MHDFWLLLLLEAAKLVFIYWPEKNCPEAELVVYRMECREACGACCIAPSISSPIPGAHPEGKPANLRCGHLDEQFRCAIFGSPERPILCERFQADEEVCGSSREQALQLITALEIATGAEQ